MKRAEFLANVKEIKKTTTPEVIKSHGGMNKLLMAMYTAQTGHTIFRTFRAWKELGYSVKKGESSFPIFSRPVSVIKAEQGKETSSEESTLFGACHLFHDGQVQPLQQTETFKPAFTPAPVNYAQLV